MGFSSDTASASDVPANMFPFPFSLYPLPDDLRHGLVAPGLLGLLSAIATVAVLSFIIWRFITWRSHYRTFVGYNQYVVLVMNLLITELAQGISFVYSFHWIQQDGIFAPTRTCFSQGFLLHLGDVGSGFFVFAIALHTFYGAVKGRRIEHRTFTYCIVFIWAFALTLTAIGPIQHREHFFVRAGAWCWVSSQYEKERLALHYIWIFIVQFGTVVIYAMILLHLRRGMTAILPTASQSPTYAKIDRAAKLMVVYPLSYIVLTLPLSAGRMWSMAHGGENLPDAYSCIAGAMLGSCGLVDALLYTLTRRSLLKNSMPVSAGRTASNPRQAGYKASEQGSSWGLEEINGGITQTRTVTVTGHRASEDTDIAMLREEIAGRRSLQKGRRAHSPSGSMDPIMGGRHLGLPGATGKSGTMATVSVEPIFDDDLKSEGSDDSVALPGRVQRAHSNARIL